MGGVTISLDGFAEDSNGSVGSCILEEHDIKHSFDDDRFVRPSASLIFKNTVNLRYVVRRYVK